VPLSPPPRDADGKVIPHDHQDIGLTDGIIRRVSEQWIVTESDGTKRLSSMAFHPSSGPNGGMSVDLQAQIEEADLNCREFLLTTSPPYAGSVRFEAGALRGAGLQAGFDPQPSNPHHGQVWGNFTDGMKKRTLPGLATWFVEMEGVAISVRARSQRQPETLSCTFLLPQQFSFWRSTGLALRFEIKALDHVIHQVLPLVKSSSASCRRSTRERETHVPEAIANCEERAISDGFGSANIEWSMRFIAPEAAGKRE